MTPLQREVVSMTFRVSLDAALWQAHSAESEQRRALHSELEADSCVST